jgi:hypothetical protein
MSDEETVPVSVETAKRRWWQQVDWPGAVAFTLALGVSGSMVVLMAVGLIGVFVRGEPISEQGATLLSTLFGAVVGALASYLGQSSERYHGSQSNMEVKK